MPTRQKDRTDPHRPSAMNPEDYVWVGVADHHPKSNVDFLSIRHDILARQGIETGVSDRHSTVNVPFFDATQGDPPRPNYRCHHCGKHGAGIRYFIFFFHKPTREVIVVGRDCAKRFRLATKTQLDIESERDAWLASEAQRKWAHEHEPEVGFLREYSKGGTERHPSLDSVAEQFETRRYLTDNQLEAVRRIMARRAQPVIDGDRHRGEVTHVDEEPTTPQIKLILNLCEELGRDKPYVKGMTRIEASDKINELQALKLRLESEPMTGKQRGLINRLMKTRSLPPEKRQEARQKIDAGLSKLAASRAINWLQSFPEV